MFQAQFCSTISFIPVFKNPKIVGIIICFTNGEINFQKIDSLLIWIKPAYHQTLGLFLYPILSIASLLRCHGFLEAVGRPTGEQREN